MLNPFAPKKKTKKPYRTVSYEQKLKTEAQKSLLNMFKDGDYETRRSVIEATTGIKLPERSVDDAQSEIIREEIAKDPEYRERVKNAYLESMNQNGGGIEGSLENIIDNAAMQKVMEDPSILEGAIKSRIAMLTGSAPTGGLRELTEQLQQFEVLKDMFGEKEKGGLINSLGDLAKAAAPLIMAVLQNQQAQQGQIQQAQPQYRAEQKQKTFIIIDDDGNVKELNETDARKLIESKQTMRLSGGQSQSNAHVHREPVQQRPAQPQQENEYENEPEQDNGNLPEYTELDLNPPDYTSNSTMDIEVGKDESVPDSFVIPVDDEKKQASGSLGLDMWFSYVEEDKDPKEFIDMLLLKSSIPGDPDCLMASQILSIFEDSSAEQILNELSQFANIPPYGEKIKLLSEKHEWLQDAIDYYVNEVLEKG